MGNIKIVCRRKNGTLEQQCFTDSDTTDAAQEALAKKFLDAFSPERVTLECTERYGESFVMVFRTDDVQMQEFEALLKEHELQNNSQNQP